MSCAPSDSAAPPAELAFLPDVWTFYFHDPDQNDWTVSSYVRVCDMGCAEEFWGLHGMVKPHVSKGMFFIMRGDVFPCWDDPANINGACMSFMVSKASAPDAWEHFCTRLLCESLCKDPSRASEVNGLSISPKHDFCIIKIWLQTTDLSDASMFDVPAACSRDALVVPNRSKLTSTK